MEDIVVVRREGGRQGRWYNEGNESFMVAVWLSLVYKLFSSSQKHKKRRISLQKLRTNVSFEITSPLLSPPLQLIFPRQFLKRVVGFTSTNEQGSGTFAPPRTPNLLFPDHDGPFSLLCLFTFFFIFFFSYIWRDSSRQRPHEDVYPTPPVHRD